jgi:hypothetical protein
MSVAQILAAGNKLDGATVEVHGQVRLSLEISSFADSSVCRGAQTNPCKLSFGIGKTCRVSGSRFSGLGCNEALFQVMKEQFPPIYI